MRAIGCMRLSTDAALAGDEAAGIAVVHAALDAGVRLLDTADAYAPDGRSIGHNERLIAKALATWSGDRSTVTVATKGGLTRPNGAWVPDGRAKHLLAACEASLQALSLPVLPLYQLHAVDPRTSLATSARALAKAHKRGLVDRVGLCNVNLTQLQEARRFVDVTSVQVQLGPRVDEAVRGGVVAFCLAEGIDVLAYRPLGGAAKCARWGLDVELRRIAEAHAATPWEVLLAWLAGLGDEAGSIIPLPGPTQPSTATSCGRVLSLRAADERALDARFEFADLLRRRPSQRRPQPVPPRHDCDVVMVIGTPGAGKTRHALPLVDAGYVRLNRDGTGGRLRDLIPRLAEHLAAGRRKVVLDNTYGTRASRNRVVEAAWKHGAPVRCVWIDTPLPRARRQAVRRMLERYDGLLDPEVMKDRVREDPNAFPPRVQTEYVRTFEPPQIDEGFEAVDRMELPPAADPPGKAKSTALILDLDRVLGTPPTATPTLLAALERRARAGAHVIGWIWRPGATPSAEPNVAPPALADPVRAVLGMPITVLMCTHPAGPQRCWCRPPMPGLLLLALHRLGAQAHGSAVVANTPAGRRFAEAADLPCLAPDAL